VAGVFKHGVGLLSRLVELLILPPDLRLLLWMYGLLLLALQL